MSVTRSCAACGQVVPEEPVPEGPAHTESGAPTDKAHKDAGDGYTTGSVPAGLTVDEMLEQGDTTTEAGTD